MSFAPELFNDAPDTQTQAKLVSLFWPGTSWRSEDFSAFFRYFNERILLLKWSYCIDHNQFAAQTFDDLIAVVEVMRIKNQRTREEVSRSIRQLPQFQRKQATDLQILNSMALAGCVWLTMEIRMSDQLYGPASGASEAASWGPLDTLVDVVKQRFQTFKFNPATGEAQLDAGFIAINLMEVCGIRITWTDNLIDHLYYDSTPVPRRWWEFWKYQGSGGIVYIYPHKICLASHHASTDILGKELLEETMKSLDLLFPFGDSRTRGHLIKERHPFFLAETPTFPRTMDLSDFNFWRRRIIILYDVFHAPPSRMHQIWKDRRNPMQWWTFWLAGLIVIITVVFGVISAYMAPKSLGLANLTYRLSILQACNQDTAI
ncbi:hypothetical protein GLAREA_07979 [Glarea lozoyensis ATCC 20868]|uniref:Uncharacterized protein n=1 Tax=Glarea lozoyensis (strain ATCC 20868 / MF5171) TaxID=1116229 RepID=S3CFU9_GLAL2|nr:uncharacterized protein GLAREA_07979 [Glarea lozoyensis ATCC 20868]EPE24129.1 hypothetical protein GLAREA_07979 [Glarea lozoyensis ATCC 20868]